MLLLLKENLKVIFTLFSSRQTYVAHLIPYWGLSYTSFQQVYFMSVHGKTLKFSRSLPLVTLEWPHSALWEPQKEQCPTVKLLQPPLGFRER